MTATTTMLSQEVDSPWTDDDPLENHGGADWNKLHNAFNTVGYREGLNAGKESDALQLGFDQGFADVGAPVGRELGFSRGVASALSSFLSSSSSSPSSSEQPSILDISAILTSLTFSDIAPRDLEAEDHARTHLEEMEDETWIKTRDHAVKHLEDADTNEIVSEKRVKESLEEILERLSSVKGAKILTGQKEQERKKLEGAKEKLGEMCEELGLDVNWS